MSKIGDSSTFQKLINMIKTALSGKANSSHTHTKSQITDFPSSMPASDVYSWAKASTKPSYAYSELSGRPTLGTAAAKDVPSSGNASNSQVVMGNDSRLSNSRSASDVYSWAKASSKPSYSWSEINAKPSSMPASDVYEWAKASTSTFGGIKVGVDASNVMEGTTGTHLRIKHSQKITLDAPDVDIPSGTTFNSTWKIGSTYSNYLDYVGDANAMILRSNAKLDLCSKNGTEVCSYDNTTWAAITASAFTVASSEKIKKNIEDMTVEEAKKLFNLRPVRYDYIDEEAGTNCYGFIAEEVRDNAFITYPVSVIDNDKYGEIPVLDYSKFVPYLTKVCQMQQAEIDELRNEINELKRRFE